MKLPQIDAAVRQFFGFASYARSLPKLPSLLTKNHLSILQGRLSKRVDGNPSPLQYTLLLQSEPNSDKGRKQALRYL
jgi:hypothetical protein